MIDGFKKNHWYRFNGKARNVLINFDGTIGTSRYEEFMLDGEWHQCKKVYNKYEALFYDCCEPSVYCVFGDYTKPTGERLYMFDEMPTNIMNIKKLKELQHD